MPMIAHLQRSVLSKLHKSNTCIRTAFSMNYLQTDKGVTFTLEVRDQIAYSTLQIFGLECYEYTQNYNRLLDVKYMTIT